VNDFTKFGATQGGESLKMDICWFRWAGCPDELVHVYIKLKTELLALSRVKVTCRDDGEPGTYLFNCLYDIAVTASRFGWRALWRGYWLFGGDDEACDHIVPTCHTWFSRWSKHIRTMSKLQYPEVADFCGWLLVPDIGIVRDPLVLLFKCWAKVAHGQQSRDFLGSFALEFRYTYDAIRRGAALDATTLLCVNLLCGYVHKELPVLALALFNRADEDLSFAHKLRERLEYWRSKSFAGRARLLRVAEASLARENRGFSEYVDSYIGQGLLFDQIWKCPPPQIVIWSPSSRLKCSIVASLALESLDRHGTRILGDSLCASRRLAPLPAPHRDMPPPSISDSRSTRCAALAPMWLLPRGPRWWVALSTSSRGRSAWIAISAFIALSIAVMIMPWSALMSIAPRRAFSVKPPRQVLLGGLRPRWVGLLCAVSMGFLLRLSPFLLMAVVLGLILAFVIPAVTPWRRPPREETFSCTWWFEDTALRSLRLLLLYLYLFSTFMTQFSSTSKSAEAVGLPASGARKEVLRDRFSGAERFAIQTQLPIVANAMKRFNVAVNNDMRAIPGGDPGDQTWSDKIKAEVAWSDLMVELSRLRDLVTKPGL